jgi:hypothetical protein
MLGENRTDALYRLVVGGIYGFLYITVIVWALLFVGGVLWVVDTVWQLLTDREGIAPMNYYSKSWETQSENAMWVATGQGEFQLAIA